MTSQQLQASGVSVGLSTGLRCIAYTETGNICGRPASVLDTKRGGMVCHVHAPKPAYEVTRAFLAKVEDLLREAGEHAKKEKRSGDPDRSGTILELAVKTRLVRCLLENGGSNG